MEQLDLAFPFDNADADAYLARHWALKRELSRVQEDLSTLDLEFQTRLPLRAMRTALKVVLARKKLAEHPKEPLDYCVQELIEDYVLGHLLRLEAETQAAVESLRTVPDLTGEG